MHAVDAYTINTNIYNSLFRQAERLHTTFRCLHPFIDRVQVLRDAERAVALPFLSERHVAPTNVGDSRCMIYFGALSHQESQHQMLRNGSAAT